MKRLFSLLLQLALLALLVFALGDPRAAADAAQGAQPRRARRRERVDEGDRRRARSNRTVGVGPSADEVKKLVRGLGGADRMLIAQMDAAVTPLGPMSGDAAELERAASELRGDRHPRRLSRALCASRPTRCAALAVRRRSSWSPTELGRRARRVRQGACIWAT